jgi:phi13 family phage major tail protein
MAKIGLNNFRYSVATVNETTGAITYGTPKKPAKAISFSFEPTVADAKLYADDTLAESDFHVTGGNVTMGIDREDLQTQCDMLGHTYTDGEVVDNVDDVAPYVGLGRITKLMVDGAIKYRGTVLALVKFNEPSESDQTQGENVEFNTTELSGSMVVPEDGNWRHRKIFDSKAEAITYIEGLLTGTSSASTNTETH